MRQRRHLFGTVAPQGPTATRVFSSLHVDTVVHAQATASSAGLSKTGATDVP